MEESAPLRIMLVTDAWEPQVNGVVRTLSRTVEECRAMGHEVEVIHPGLGFKTFPLPTYPEIKMAVGAPGASGIGVAAEPSGFVG